MDHAETLRRERAYWDRFASEAPPLSERRLARLVCDRQLAYLPPRLFEDRDVLEVCCGDARTVRFLAEHRARTSVGLDLSRAQLDRALAAGRTRVLDGWLSAALPPNCRLALGDALDLSSFGEGSFDLVAIHQGLHHLAEVDAFLAGARRVLRADGRLVITEPNGGHPLRGLSTTVVKAVGYTPKEERHLKVEEVLEALERCGFEAVSVRGLNLFSEVNFHFSSILARHALWLGEVVLLANLLLRPIDDLLEAVFLDGWPNLGWRFLIVAAPRLTSR